MVLTLLLAITGPWSVAANVFTADAIRVAGDPFAKFEPQRDAIKTLGIVATDDAYRFLAERITVFYLGLERPLRAFSGEDDPPEDWYLCLVALTRHPDGRPRRDERAARAIVQSLDREIWALHEVMIPRALISLLGENGAKSGKLRARAMLEAELSRTPKGEYAANLRKLIRQLGD
jgi:hypothetical protein